MTHTSTTARLATTAIAAALALSATPLIAQDVPPPADTTAAPPASTSLDPLAAEPVATEPAAEPAPVTTATEPTASKPAASTRAKTATRTASTARAPARAVEPAAVPAATTPPAEPTDVAPIIDVPLDEPATPAPVEPAATSQIDMAEVLPFAGAGALGVLGLTGAAVALRRRRRRREDALAEEQWQAEQAWAEPIAVDPLFDNEPKTAPILAAAAPRHDPLFDNKPKTALPAGFDLSRFGRHVQAAYRGPTPDNPSLSLKYRLRRASALDQKERLAGTAEAETRTAKAPAARPMVHSGGDFMLGGTGPKTVVRPAYSKAK